MVYKTCSAENHNGHNGLFKSEAAIQYIKVKNAEYKKLYDEYKKLYDEYKGKVPDDMNRKFYEGIDKFKTCELDADFMNEINAFFEKQL